MKKTLFFFLFIGIFSIPFYFFKSGTPQISHLFLILTFIQIIIIDKKIFNFSFFFKGYNYLFLFTLWSFFISAIVFMLYQNLHTIMAPLYFIFNLIVMYILSRYYLVDPLKLLNYIYNIIFANALLLFTIGYFDFDTYFNGGTSYYRKVLTFNNPNQLGYWALSAATILFMLYKYHISKFSKVKFIFSLFFLLYISIISLSKAATISIIILIMLNSISNIKSFFIFLLLGLVIYNSSFNYNKDSDNALVKFNNRMTDVGDQSDDNLEGRGYDRIYNYPEYIFFGAGEGAIERFNTNDELHSSFGTILFSYGIVGLILFLMFLYKIYSLNPIKFIKILLPLLLYGITHMGLRFTLFWVSLALFILLEKKTKISSKNTLKIQENRMIQN